MFPEIAVAFPEKIQIFVKNIQALICISKLDTK